MSSLSAGGGSMDLLPRLAAESLKGLLAELRIVIINGPRQSGKTTLLRSCRRFGDATFTTLDDPSELAIAKDDPRTFVRRRPRPVIIDEIQRAGDPLILAIKQVVNEDWSEDRPAPHPPEGDRPMRRDARSPGRWTTFS
ncbi:AAA family ATPase [Nonomuraea polychroma]|uniref:AAA family ATPase n=1 Tax=Nonomuraea polychroma TaxID=46176 RepID=UPI003D941968